MTDRKAAGNWLEDFVPYLLYRISDRLNQNLRDRLRPEGVRLSHWRVLAVLAAEGESSIGELVKQTVLQQPTVSRVVAQMEQAGLIRRKQAEDDSRVVQVSLTADGEELFASIMPLAKAHQERALRGFTDTEIASLKSLLDRIRHNIELEI